MTSHPHNKGNPRSALEIFASNPHNGHRRLISQSSNAQTTSGYDPPPPVKILNSLLPVYDTGRIASNPPSLKTRRSESSGFSKKYSETSSPWQSSSTLDKTRPPTHSKSPFARVKKAASQLIHSRRVDSPAQPPPVPNSLNVASSYRVPISLEDSNASSDLPSSTSRSSNPAGAKGSSIPSRSLSGIATGEHTAQDSVSHKSFTSSGTSGTVNSNSKSIQPYSSNISTAASRTSVPQPLPSILSGDGPALKTKKQSGYEDSSMAERRYPSESTEPRSSTSAVASSINPSSSSQRPLSSPMFQDTPKPYKTCLSNENITSRFSGRPDHTTTKFFPPFQPYIPTDKGDGPAPGRSSDDSPPGTSGVRRSDHKNGWNGEWNQPDIQDVIDKLRALR